MIEEPEDEVGITRRRDAGDKGKPKQEPVIKGVLPDQPAPPAPAPRRGGAGGPGPRGLRGGASAAANQPPAVASSVGCKQALRR